MAIYRDTGVFCLSITGTENFQYRPLLPLYGMWYGSDVGILLVEACVGLMLVSWLACLQCWSMGVVMMPFCDCITGGKLCTKACVCFN